MKTNPNNRGWVVRAVLLTFVATVLVSTAFGYGPEGHQTVGAKPIDVVHMLRNCIAIIEGHNNATNNPTGITQKTALRLLVHYVGDIHQPLHVGTAYFGTNAQLVNPSSTTGAQADGGGNLIEFHGTNLHVYWDTTAVQNAMAAANVQTPRAFARTIIRNPPPGWETSSIISGC